MEAGLDRGLVGPAVVCDGYRPGFISSCVNFAVMIVEADVKQNSTPNFVQQSFLAVSNIVGFFCKTKSAPSTALYRKPIKDLATRGPRVAGWLYRRTSSVIVSVS